MEEFESAGTSSERHIYFVNEHGQPISVTNVQDINIEGQEAQEVFETDFESLCRLCASPNDCLIPIFEGEGLENLLGDKINEHLPIKVNPDDTLPRVVCYQCASHVLAWHDLKECTLKADEQLKKFQDVSVTDLKRKAYLSDGSKIIEMQVNTKKNTVEVESSKDDNASTEERLENDSSENLTSKSLESTSNEDMDEDNVNDENVATENENNKSTTDVPSEPASAENKNETLMMVVQNYDSDIETEEYSDLILENEENEESQMEADINSVLSDIKIVQIKNSNDRLLYCEKCDLYDDSRNIEEHIKFHNPKIKLEKLEGNDTGNDLINLFETQESNQEFVYEMLQDDTIENDAESSTDNNENGLDCESKIQMSVILSENVNENGLFVIDNEMLDKQCEDANEEDLYVAIVYQCQQCNEAFISMEKLKEHVMEQHHGKVDDKLCNLCGFSNGNKETFEEHMENEHSTYSCEFCERTFKSALSRTRHATKAHLKDVDTLECGICESSFSTREELFTHKAVHISEEGRYICPTCGTTCMTEKYLKSHISNSHNIGHEFPCEICHKIFKRKSNRWSHHSNHVYDYPCQHCCNSYNSQFSLECHIASHSPAERTVTGIINCEFQGCEEVFNSKLKYFNHQKIHLNIVDYKCETCLKFFKSESILKNHKKIHESGTVCLTCKKNFANQKTLKEHMRLHTGELPFSCKICNQKFRCQSFLAVHKTTHTGERNYKCSFCPQAFSRSSYLKEHLRTHTNDKPFVCKFCKKGYAQANVLSKHLTTMHRRCPICREIIGDKMKLQVHLWKQHPHKETKGDDEMFILTETEPMLIGEETVVGF